MRGNHVQYWNCCPQGNQLHAPWHADINMTSRNASPTRLALGHPLLSDHWAQYGWSRTRLRLARIMQCTRDRRRAKCNYTVQVCYDENTLSASCTGDVSRVRCTGLDDEMAMPETFGLTRSDAFGARPNKWKHWSFGATISMLNNRAKMRCIGEKAMVYRQTLQISPNYPIIDYLVTRKGISSREVEQPQTRSSFFQWKTFPCGNSHIMVYTRHIIYAISELISS